MLNRQEIQKQQQRGMSRLQVDKYTGMVCNTQAIAQREKIEKNGKQNTLAALIQKRRYRKIAYHYGLTQSLQTMLVKTRYD